MTTRKEFWIDLAFSITLGIVAGYVAALYF